MERNDSHQERLPVTPGKNDLEVTCDNCAHVVVVIGECPWPGLQYFPCVSMPSLVVNKGDSIGGGITHVGSWFQRHQPIFEWR